jgi:hypothetical protein
MDTALMESPPVAKQKKPAPRPLDAEKPFLLKLPHEYREALQAAKERTGREMTVSGQIALEMYFRAIGVPFTPNWPEIQLPSPQPARRSTS